jgi:nucleotide-binding universal stress UspA family protein
MFRKILYPIDSYESASAALAHVKMLKQAGTREVVALGVVEMGGCAWTGRNLEECYADRFEKERTEIQAILKEMEKEGVRGKVIVEAGIPARTILKVADEEDVSLIVIGPGRGDMKGLLLGEAVEDVVRYANVPVLVMR